MGYEISSFHAWTYDLSGKLMGAAYMEDVEDFDLDQCRLKPIRSEVWQGWIFVNFDNEAPALTDFIADYAEEFGFLNQDRFRLSTKRTTKLACNWKLVNENFVDIYHILTLHSDTLVNWPKPEDYAYRRLAHGGYAAFYDNLLPTLDPLIELGPAPWLGPHLAGKNTKTYAAAGFLSPNVTSIVPALLYFANDRVAALAEHLRGHSVHNLPRELFRRIRLPPRARNPIRR